MKTYILFAACLFFIGCSKTKFLNTNPNPSLNVPSTLADYQAILDNDFTMNGEAGYGVVPSLGETAADNYYVTDAVYNSVLHPLYQRAYVWDKAVFENEQIYDWNTPYQVVERANTVLDGLQTISIGSTNQTAYNKAKGSALFYRAHMFYQLAQVFCKAFNKDSAAQLLGIPLRITSSLTEPLKRSSLEETYEKIIGDIKAALPLLPTQPAYATQPGKTGCYGLLTRTYLTMGYYDSSLLYADSCLQLKSDLMDYNIINGNSYYPFSAFNAEDIFQCEMIKAPDVYPVNINYAYIDTTLYALYDSNDLRKAVYFKARGNGYFFTGSYSGFYGMFGGIATNEIYLTRAECEARMNDYTHALDDLNFLLEKRYKAGTFVPYTISNTSDILELILKERRKELCFRGLRWTDLRRLNAQGANIELQRHVNGNSFSLLPNDTRYVYPIPTPVITLNPAMQQNIR